MSTRHLQDILLSLLVLGIFFFIKIPYLSTVVSTGIILIYTSFQNGAGNELGFKWPSRLDKTLGFAVLIAIMLTGLSFIVILPIIESVTDVPYNLGPFEQLRNNPNQLFISIGIGWIIGGFMEEIIFRGYLLSRITAIIPGKFGILSGILLTASIFGYLHGYQGITGQLMTGIFGAILGAMYLFNQRNIWLNIFVHGVVNTISMVLVYMNVV